MVQFFYFLFGELEVSAASSVCNIRYLYTVTRVDIGVDLDWLENPDISLIVFDQDFMHHVLLID